MRITLEGFFDREAALRLRERLRACPAGVRIAVDFSRLERVHDVALGLFAGIREGLSCELSVVGLPSHAERILRALAPDLAT